MKTSVTGSPPDPRNRRVVESVIFVTNTRNLTGICTHQ
jgi:hypothetical protein